MDVAEITGDDKWQRLKYRDKRALIKGLTCELASRVFFGDDILKNSNVVRDDFVKKRPRLDRGKMANLKQVVSDYVQMSGEEFEIEWLEAEKCLQTRIKNLRKNSVRTATSGQLVHSNI